MTPDTIARARGGDREAYSDMAVEFSDRLFAVAFRILRDAHAAEDAVQQAFLIGWREIGGLRDDSRAEGWFYRLVVNACYAELRHARRWQPGLRVAGAEEPSIDDAQVGLARRDELDRAFKRLSPEQRAVVVLHHYLGLSGTEVATVLGLSPGTVRSRLHYARQSMRAAIEADTRPVASGGVA